MPLHGLGICLLVAKMLTCLALLAVIFVHRLSGVGNRIISDTYDMALTMHSGRIEGDYMRDEAIARDASTCCMVSI